MNLLDDVTDVQKEAITHIEGPLLVVAGAGSGKTRVITRRIGYLIEQGVNPYNILALTFTNKASKEMRERIEKFCQVRGMWVSTFHAMCARILRIEINKLGYDSSFTIYDKQDQLSAIKEVMKVLEIDTTSWKPATISAIIGKSKNDLISAEKYAATMTAYKDKVIAQVYTKYEETLKQNNALDFDDLLIKVVDLFKGHPDVLKHYQDKFKYILIDEYQDTNRTQYVIAKLLSQEHKNICATGDPDQSIYSWRGADIRNILDFENDFTNTKTVKLEQNYRSTKRILQAATGVISNNSMRKDKTLWTENPEGNKIKVICSNDENTEALIVTSYINKFKSEDNIDYTNMAIFYRTNAQSRTIEGALRSSRIPYTIVGSVEFYRRKEVKDILAYLKLCINPDDNIALTRIINVPTRGVGKVTLDKLRIWANENNISMVKALFRLTGQTFPGDMDQTESDHYIPDTSLLKGKAKTGINKLVGIISEIASMAMCAQNGENSSLNKVPVMHIVKETIRLTQYEKFLQATEEIKSVDKIENINELSGAANEYDKGIPDGTLAGFLENVSLVADLDSWDEKVDAVTLMTLHSAKGLEFPVVFLTGMEDGLLPHSQSKNSENGIEEERRLCYVGITRAEKELIITHVRSRFRNGTTMACYKSPFLREIPKEAIETIGDYANSYSEQNYKTSNFPDEFDEFDETSDNGFSPGEAVRHSLFGIGRIEQIAGNGDSCKVKVNFNTGGLKMLVLKYAKLEKVY